MRTIYTLYIYVYQYIYIRYPPWGRKPTVPLLTGRDKTQDLYEEIAPAKQRDGWVEASTEFCVFHKERVESRASTAEWKQSTPSTFLIWYSPVKPHTLLVRKDILHMFRIWYSRKVNDSVNMFHSRDFGIATPCLLSIIFGIKGFQRMHGNTNCDRVSPVWFCMLGGGEGGGIMLSHILWANRMFYRGGWTLEMLERIFNSAFPFLAPIPKLPTPISHLILEMFLFLSLSSFSFFFLCQFHCCSFFTKLIVQGRILSQLHMKESLLVAWAKLRRGRPLSPVGDGEWKMASCASHTTHFRRISPCSLATSLQVCGSCFFQPLGTNRPYFRKFDLLRGRK